MRNIKSQLIQLLCNSTDWLSGEAISQQFGISRAAIAKHINALRQEGYLIEAATRRGYLLKQSPDIIDLNVIQEKLNTKQIGRGQWLLLPESSSTNQQAMLSASAGALEGSIIIANKQTSGRGTKGKVWFSPPRSISFSVVLRPAFAPEKLSLIINMAMLAIQDTLEKLANLETALRAPNDVYVGDKKIAGVLIETALISHEIDWVVLGIGCNLNVELSEFPTEIQPYITSTLHEVRQSIGRNAFYKVIIQRLDYYYQLISHQQDQFQEIWQSRNH